MKCALELTSIATARELEIKMKRRKAREKFTLEFCNDIGHTFENRALNGDKDFTFNFYCAGDDRNNRPLYTTSSDYADGRFSVNWIPGQENLALDLELLVEWFNSYCFSVEVKKTREYCYGLNIIDVYHVFIKPDIQC